jgi:hypothetical protein
VVNEMTTDESIGPDDQGPHVPEGAWRR